MVKPRVGYGEGNDAWVGGSNVENNKRTRPKSTLSRRPTDFKSSNLIETKAVAGLHEDRKLGSNEKTSKISLSSWVNSLKLYMEDRGLDTVFRMFDATTQTETYLLED